MSISLEPMMATLIHAPFDDPEWIFEIKLDGFRAIAELSPKEVSIYSRNRNKLNKRFPEIVTALKKLKLDAIIDGEIVALDEHLISRFQLLQDQSSNKNIFYYVFDILSLDGKDLRNLPLIERKAILKKILKRNPRVIYLEHVEEQGIAFFNACATLGCEGVMGKNKGSLYQSGKRSKQWVKIKVVKQQEVMICGFTEPKKSRKDLGALVVGVYKNRELRYAGHVGGGFTEQKLQEVKRLLSPLITEKCPFKKPPKTHSGVTWVQPRYLCKVKFQEWTRESQLRQPIFLGMRKKMARKKTPFYDLMTHPDKIFWEEEHITKGDLVHYYQRIAPFILPYLRDRPETLKRFPNGIKGQTFFQKNITHYPEWINTVEIQHKDKKVNYLLIQNVKSLLYAVNLGCIEIHPWFSRIQHLDYPDFLIFDLDPENIPFSAVAETALMLHTILDEIHVPNVCKTSGKRGLHIGIPLRARYTYAQAKQFAQLIGIWVQSQLPSITSLERSPKSRQKQVYIDCFQNNYGQTLIAPYSVRAEPKAPVSTPLEWEELKHPIDPHDYTIFNIEARLKEKGDLFKPVLGKSFDMSQALKLLQNRSCLSSQDFLSTPPA